MPVFGDALEGMPSDTVRVENIQRDEDGAEWQQDDEDEAKEFSHVGYRPRTISLNWIAHHFMFVLGIPSGCRSSQKKEILPSAQ
jgi:hypothetical protein